MILRPKRHLELTMAAMLMAVALPAEEPPTLQPAHAEILLLGTFHFSDAGLDEFKPAHDVDILSPRRQSELQEVVELLEEFAPTKIAVEWLPSQQEAVDEQYRLYREGRFELPSNEIYQLGFRLAARLGHERVHLVDARKRDYEPWVDPDEFALGHGQVEALDQRRYTEYGRIHRYEDERKTRHTLRETLVYLNEPDRLIRSHGIYLVGSFRAGDGERHPGADSKTAWYNRNLRIASNLLRVAEDGDRVLTIIGSGHVPILRHAILASPDVTLVNVEDVLEKPLRERELEDHLRTHSYLIERRDGGFSGAGWERLLAEGEASRFFSIAEPHNTADLPHFTGELALAISQLDDRDVVLALEQGPTITQLAAEGGARDGLEGIFDVARRYPGALHFSTDQELRLIADFAARGPLGPTGVIGIDRELRSQPILDRLLALPLEDDAKALVRALLGRVVQGGLVSHEDDVTRLAAAIDGTAGAAASALLDTLRSSDRVLRTQANASRVPGGGYLANRERERAMKHLFTLQYRSLIESATVPPRAVIKLGHWHLTRGLNPSRVASVAGLLAGWAQASGSSLFSLNVQVINRPGQYWSLTDYEEYAPLARVGDPDEWTLVDLRSARGLLYSGELEASVELRKMIDDFDAVLLMGGASAGTSTWQDGGR